MNRRSHRTARNTGGEEGLDLADLARFRQAAYRIFSTVLLYPDEEQLRTLAAAAGELRDQRNFLSIFSFFIQWRDLLDSLRACADLEPARVQEEYVTLFIANPEYSPCFPYESVYMDSAGATGWTAVKLEREYAAAGLSISPSLKESPDHVAVELEFMSFLCDQEATACEEMRLADAIGTLRRQAAFLEGHLNRWFPAFALEVNRKKSSGIYTAVTRAARTFISHDRGLVGVLLDRFESVASS